LSCECEKCKGICDKSIADRVIQMLGCVDTVSSRAGEIITSRAIGGLESTMVVTGVEYTGEDMVNMSKTDVMFDAYETSLPIKRVFNGVRGISVESVVKEHLKSSNASEMAKKRVLDMIRQIDSGKRIGIPIKLGTLCNAIVQIEGKKLKRELTIQSIKVNYNKETKEVEYLLRTEKIDTGGIDKVRPTLNLEEYGYQFTLTNIDAIDKHNVKSQFPIKMTKSGFIRPIEIVSSSREESIILDGSNIYKSNNSGTYVIGEWRDEKIGINKNESMHPDFADEIKRMLGTVSRHRRYIVPYLVMDTYKILI